MEKYVSTDLAVENFERLKNSEEGATVEREQRDGIRLERVTVQTVKAARQLGKPIGCYVTVQTDEPQFMTAEAHEALLEMLRKELFALCCPKNDGKEMIEGSTLVVGLGNTELTADAIGPRTVAKLTATRHLKLLEPALYSALGCGEISMIVPGVLGKTGIEALELIRAAVHHVKPDRVILIDALAAGSLSRLANTVQLTNTGIVPGSGVGNHRMALDRKTLGVPVIAIGVPTVVHSATLIYDTLAKAGVDGVEGRLESVLENGIGFFVSPKECDTLVELFSELLAQLIQRTFVGDLAL